MASEWISRDAVLKVISLTEVFAHYNIEAGSSRGSSFRIHCPFHEDDRPSCSVNLDAKLYNCFACGEQGNVFDLIAGLEEFDPNTQFRSVLEKAIEIMGHNPSPKRGKKSSQVGQNEECKKGSKGSNSSKKMKTDSVSKQKTEKRKRSKKKSNDKSLELEPNTVLDGPAFPLKLSLENPWLKQRLSELGVSIDAAKAFGIGYETRSNALMAGRVCFPIHNFKGELVAYSGRWSSDDLDDQGLYRDAKGDEQPRYKLPTGFQKQLELFNLHRVINQFEVLQPETRSIVMVEGFWSTLRLSSFTGYSDHASNDDRNQSNADEVSNLIGIPCVGLMGTSLSDAHIQLLMNVGVERILLMLDGDETGQKASEEIISRLSKAFYVKDAGLSENQMPDMLPLSRLMEILDGSSFQLGPKCDVSDMVPASHGQSKTVNEDHFQCPEGYSIKGSARL